VRHPAISAFFPAPVVDVVSPPSPTETFTPTPTLLAPTATATPVVWWSRAHLPLVQTD
jgi:hypothetical protein